jgi:hypothetical protein
MTTKCNRNGVRPIVHRSHDLIVGVVNRRKGNDDCFIRDRRQVRKDRHRVSEVFNDCTGNHDIETSTPKRQFRKGKIDHLDIACVLPAGKPKAIFDALVPFGHSRGPRTAVGLVQRSGEWNALELRCMQRIDCGDAGTSLFGFKRKKSGCGADVENGLPGDWIMADVLVELPANVPYTGDGLAVGEIHRVIEHAFRPGRCRGLDVVGTAV